MTTALNTDYLIVGSGAVGMAFADTLLSETEADIIIVDRFAKPGGHWNVAYPFVTLHQPSAFYGVGSHELSKGLRDTVGLNKGLGDLASGAEVSAYFDHVMRHRFLPSGRVRYFPMCDYQGDGHFTCRLTGQTFQVTSRKTVDATWLKTSVPATHTPGFGIAEGVRFIPVNGLTQIDAAPDRYVVIGGGKTGIDACLWLLENRVAPEAVTWIRPRDGWLIDRKNTQSSEDFFADSIGAQAAQMEAIAGAETVTDIFDRLEASGYFLRIDIDVRPTMFHGATVSRAELERLRSLTDIVRMGRVRALEPDRIVLEHGERATTANTLHIDCSASAIPNLDIKPVFEGDLITPQTVRSYQPVFSAAFIAHIEATYETEADKNRLCQVVPLPNRDIDYLAMTAAFIMNQHIWSKEPGLREWLMSNRLDGFSRLVSGIGPDQPDKVAILTRLRAAAMPAMARLQQFMADARAETPHV